MTFSIFGDKQTLNFELELESVFMLSEFLISSLDTRYTYLYNYKNLSYFHAKYSYSSFELNFSIFFFKTVSSWKIFVIHSIVTVVITINNIYSYMYLIYINRIGKTFKGENMFEFLFSDSTEWEWDESWYESSVMTDTRDLAPDESIIKLVGSLKTDEFDLEDTELDDWAVQAKATAVKRCERSA
jgi:hypothetical protein